MSQNHESCLRFSLEESVWFQKGQEVAELVSISLDPNISIQENEQYVTIKGALELTGEFRRYEDDAVEEEDLFSAPKFVHRVEERQEGILEFFHRFPVDITIPNNRIQAIDDINIEVESFDYLFQERSCMKLTADLTITGLYGDQQHKPAYETREDDNDFEPDVAEMTTEEGSLREDQVEEVAEEIQVIFEPRQEEAEVEVELELELVENLYEPFEAEARRSPEGADVNVTVSVIEDAPQMAVNEAQEPEIYFQASRKEVTIEETLEEVETSPMAETPPVVVEPEVKVQAESPKPVAEQEEESSSSPIKPVQKKKKNSKKGLSLTEFFARKEEGEDLVKLRVAIVQEGETIEQLANRYSVPVQQLLKVNHLELQQDVYEGQVLYIPIAVAHK